MALQTSGFQLSQLERAPQLPTNLGVVDSKAIYGAVTDALKTNEALRTAQQLQQATDAELTLATQRAQTEQGLLGSESAARKAKADLLTAGAPYQTALLPLEDRARRAELAANETKNRILSEEPTSRSVIEGRMMSPAVKTQVQFQKLLDQGGLSEEAALAIRAKLGQALSAEQQAKLNANRNQIHQAVVDGQVVQWRNDGAIRYPGQTDWAFGTALPAAGMSTSAPVTAGSAPLATEVAPTGLAPASTGAGTPAPAAGGILSSGGTGVRVGGESGKQKRDAAAEVKRSEKSQELLEKIGQKVIEDQADELKKLPKVREVINTQLDNNALVEKAIDDAIAKVKANSTVTGGGKVGKFIRTWVSPQAADDFVGDIETIQSNIGFGVLQKMRQDSPTGGALGNVSNTEGAKLDTALGSLKTDLSPDQMITNLENVRAARRTALTRLQEAYSADEKRAHRTIFRTSAQLFPDEPLRVPQMLLTPEQVAALQRETEPAAPAQVPMDSISTKAFEASNAPSPAAPAESTAVINFGETPTPEAAPLAPAPVQTAAPEGFVVKSVNNQPVTPTQTRSSRFQPVNPDTPPAAAPTQMPVGANGNAAWWSTERNPAANQEAVLEFFKRIPEASLKGIRIPAETLMGAAEMAQKSGGAVAKFFTPSNWKWAGNNVLVFDPPQAGPVTTLPNIPAPNP